MIISRFLFCLSLLVLVLNLNAQQTIPAKQVVETDVLVSYLNNDVVENLGGKDNITEAVLAEYFREKFSERFFYKWEEFESRFGQYNTTYNMQALHQSRAEDHMGKYADSTNWLLPFNYLNGEPVNAYALRHLARQHKMVDVSLQYFYSGKDVAYIDYFTRQLSSLNDALETNRYESIEDGNGVYEVFRSGYRVLNWLRIHNMFLGEEAYSDEEQLLTIATLLQHGADLYATNPTFRPGNHQTRGMSALAMLSILFRDFKGADLWYQRSMEILGVHLDKEINDDGFQFERSVHYHMSDIENYFYVYQLALKSNIEIDSVWQEKLKSLFVTLVKIAYPDKSAPVLQDDTDNPWAERNDISGALAIGYLLFQDPEFGYLAANNVSSRLYWFLSKEQTMQLDNIAKKKPSYGSLAFNTTHYYIMREGWDENDKMMIISAGVDSQKPDHQHGDVLGIQAMANQQVVLPNYQVRYPLKDFEVFKNSMVKNVALVDNELQGKEWTSNRGGSGFGKFKSLPQPKVIAWQSTSEYDFFAGSHDGFENVGVSYSRQVLNVENNFWIVKDNFSSENEHTYKQVWQGNFTSEEGADLIRANFSDASGCDILQLINVDEVSHSGRRGKQWNVLAKNSTSDFSFISLIYPYSGHNNRIDEDLDAPTVCGWKLNAVSFEVTGINFRSLSKDNEAYLFLAKEVNVEGVNILFSAESDLYLTFTNDIISIHSISSDELETRIEGAESVSINGVITKNKVKLKPGDRLLIKK